MLARAVEGSGLRGALGGCRRPRHAQGGERAGGAARGVHRRAGRLRYVARGAILQALAAYGPAEATATIKTALTDKDWAIRVTRGRAPREDRAGHRRASGDPAGRPAPQSSPYDDAQLTAPDTVTARLRRDRAGHDRVRARGARGTADDAQFHRARPQGVLQRSRRSTASFPNFVVQDGDPRGDGEGGPGYTIRDELNERPYLRGTVGMALDWHDTGGSQFFITHSPQPHLDARYTVFGHVVNGMEVVDQIQQGDVIQRVRIWDGKGWQ